MNDDQIFVKIAGTGSFLPGNPVAFSEIDKILGELHEAPVAVKRWMKRVRGLMQEMIDVKYYHFAIDPVTRQFTDDNVTMSVKAASLALERAAMRPSEIDLIIYGSAHQDQMPTASVRIQEALEIDHCAELSIHANCTSAYKALMLGSDLIRNGRYRNVLVISSGISSSELIDSYYNQQKVTKEEVFLRYFLSDGASAVVLKADLQQADGLYVKSNYIESIGGRKPSAMGNRRPARYMNPKEEFEQGYHHLAQMFRDDLRNHFHEPDGTIFIKGLKRMLSIYPVDLKKVKYLQVNFPAAHITDLILDECEEIGIQRDAYYSKMSAMGYIGPPMALLCLDMIAREEQMETGDLIISFVTEVSKFMQGGYVIEKK